MSFKVCAIMSAYNEADIINESISKLIEQDIDVFLIDNGSADETQIKARSFLGKGLVGIETCIFHEDEREVYDWTSILKLKEKISCDLNYDWYIHVDADEIRYSPWANVSLRDGIHLVDKAGFNLINFRLFNFRLTEKRQISESIEESLEYYSPVEQFNRMQVKAWKKSPTIDLSSHGGHLAIVPNGRIFPLRFIHKHYPVRSLEQGKRKIFQERLGRYSHSDRSKGWHVQYDLLSAEDESLKKQLVHDSAKLKKFCMTEITHEILMESTKLLAYFTQGIDIDKLRMDPRSLDSMINHSKLFSDSDKKHLIETAEIIKNQIRNGDTVNIQIEANAQQTAAVIYGLIENQAMTDFMRGDPLLFDCLENLKITVND